MNFLDAAFRVCAELIHTAAHALAQASLRTRGTVPHSELLAAAGNIMRRAIPESPGGHYDRNGAKLPIGSAP